MTQEESRQLEAAWTAFCEADDRAMESPNNKALRDHAIKLDARYHSLADATSRAHKLAEVPTPAI